MVKKVLLKIEGNIIKLFSHFNVRFYMKHYVKYLQKLGVKIPDYDGRSYISPNVYFDGSRYSLISIGQGVTISTGVMMLVHDYSISRGMALVDPQYDTNKRYRFMKSIVIEDGAFIGARSFLLPGSKVGKQSIIGACSVVHGEIPAGVVATGNPAKVKASIVEWGKKHFSDHDYEEYESR